jgi:hypothetical protein
MYILLAVRISTFARDRGGAEEEEEEEGKRR